MDMANQPKSVKNLSTAELIAVNVPHITAVLNTALRFGLPSWAVVEMSKNLAGKTTFVELLALVKSDLDQQVGWLTLVIWVVLLGLAGGAIWYARYKTRYLSARVAQLERAIDKSRTSSGLGEDGSTHPRDKTE